MSDDKHTVDGETITRSKTRSVPPPMYKVLLHNDDYTTQEFVVMILESIFHKSSPEAINIMLSVHNQGVGIAGVYSREVAETKIEKVHALAQAHEYPLKCSMQPE